MSNKHKGDFIAEFKKAFEEAYAIKPSEVKAQNTLRVDFYKGFLWRLFLGSVAVVVPDSWSIDFFRATLFWGGAIGVTELAGAVVPFAYSIKERNKWHYPITVQATGELTNDIPERKIGKTCEIIYLESAAFPNAFYAGGLSNIIEIYAEKLATCDASIDVNLFVSRTPWVFGCENESDVQNMQQLVNRIMSGVPAVYYKMGRKVNPTNKDLPILKTPVKENFIALDVQASKRAIIDEFLTAIGVNNANTDKRERLITSEVEANNQEIQCAVELWQQNVTRTIAKVKKLYPDFFSSNKLSVNFGASSTLNADGERGTDEPSRINGNMAPQNGEPKQP